MKKRLIRYNFNMVEIMLAVIVIALGIAGTFVLFPVGVNANKDATANNSIADIAEYVTAFVRAEVLTGARDDEDDSDDPANLSGKKSRGFRASLVTSLFNPDGADPVSSRDYYKVIEVDAPGSSWEIPDTHASRKSGSESDAGVSMLLKHNSEKGVFLVRQVSGPEGNRFVDFAAVARVYLDRGDTGNTGLAGEFFPNASGDPVSYNGGNSDENTTLQKCFLPAILELSWPASASYEEREKRYFRFEVYNDHFRL